MAALDGASQASSSAQASNARSPYRFESFHGSGRATIRHHAGTAALSDLHFTFPLKLMSPRTASLDAVKRAKRWRRVRQDDAASEQAEVDVKPVAAIYFVGYGGGLVSGDSVLVDVDVGSSCSSLILTQGSTKVYKMRERLTNDNKSAQLMDDPATFTSRGPLTTRQEVRCIVRANATAIVLPDPVTCFARARYTQVQRFDLRCPHSSSLVLLDWFTPGRVHLDTGESVELKERWSFDSYESRNEVRVGGQVVARDVLLLEQPHFVQTKEKAARRMGPSIAQRCEPYSCYASLFLFGPDAQLAIKRFEGEFYQIQQRNKASLRDVTFDPVLWSCSPLEIKQAAHAPPSSDAKTNGSQSSSRALVVRIAGITTEDVRFWLRRRLTDLQGVIGDDLYRQALGS